MKRPTVALALLALLPSPLLAADALPYAVGVGKADVTPSHPIRLNGFGCRRAESEGVYQKIWAKALAVAPADGKEPAVLMTVDVLGIPADIYDELAKRLEKKAGVKKERLAVTATHTHTGPMLTGANPTLFGVPIPKEHLANIDKYTPVFIDKLEEAALAALKDMKPARLEWGVGSVGFAINRRNRSGPVDHDLPVLVARDAKGSVRAVYLSYACHAVTLSHNKIGGDWPGFAAAAVEDAFPGAVALVAIGCGADQNPDSGVTGGKEDVAALQGRAIVAEVRRLTASPLTRLTAPITAKTTAFDLPLADLLTREQWEARAKQNDAVGHHARVNLARLDRGEKLPTSIAYPLQTWAFGDRLAMVHLPGEVVVDYAKRLKGELDCRRLWVTAYANNAPCYIPSERVLKEGGYEGGGAMIYYDLPQWFKPGLEAKIVGAAKEQLGKAFAAPVDPAKNGGSRPLSPHQSLARMKASAGFRVELVAAEPLVADPVALAFGSDGKIWVAEMADYPTGRTDGKFDPGGRVVFLTDTDGDGLPDARSVFLDDLPFPTGVLPWRKGVLVCAAPDVLYAEDTDGDGKADKVEKLYSGFGTQNYQARVNSLQYGLDGWVYGSCGLFGGNIVCHRSKKTVALGDRDFRIKPDSGELEPATGRTQQGRVRDDRGNWFGCDNSNLIRHYVLDDHYLKRNPHVSYPNTSVNVAPASRLFPLAADAQRFALSGPPNSVTAACGLGIYRDDLLGGDVRGNSFTCEPVNLVVTRRVLKPVGSTFEGVRAATETDGEFLASTDPWFRPVHAVTGPDGGLWVADMYRFLIEHPRFLPPAELARIDPRAGAGLGRIYRVLPAKEKARAWLRLDKLDTAGLVAAFDTPNGWQRDAAMMELIWKNDRAATEPLEKLVRESKSGLARMQALCTLGAIEPNRPDIVLSTDTIRIALNDRDPAVRQHAIRFAAPFVAGQNKLTPVGKRLFELLDDADPQVQLQLSYAIGRFPGVAGVEDPTGRKILRDYSRDPYCVAAAMSSLKPQDAGSVAKVVIAASGKDGPPPQLIRDLVIMEVSTGEYVFERDVLRVTLKDPRGDHYYPWQFVAAAGALDAFDRQGVSWDKLPRDARRYIEPIVPHARDLCEKADTAENDLLTAIPLLGRDPAARDADFKRLAGLLAATRPAAVQAAAVAALGRSADKAVPAALVGAWGGATPAVRARILDTLLGRPAWHPDLLAAIEKGAIAAGQIDAARRQQLTTSADAAVRKRAEKLFAGGTNPDRQKVIEDYKTALALKADANRGKAVFAKVCSACHALDGVGHAVGPDLVALADKSPLYLLSEILDPNRNLDSRYAEYRAITKDERTVTGILAAETATSVTLRGQQAKDETLLRTFIETFRGTSKSLMPEGLEKDLPKQDAADLLAYLTAFDPPHKKMPGNAPAEVVARDNRLTLPASKAHVYGDQIVFEAEFGNIGYWHGKDDRAVWRVRLDKDAEFDVYFDYACANDSAGNGFALDAGGQTLTSKVAGTGGWANYTLAKVGALKLPAGANRVAVRPAGAVRGALFDLRTVYLVPVGAKPVAPDAKAAPSPAEQIRALTTDLAKDDAKAEYQVIPKVFAVALAAGKANDTAALRDLLGVALPKAGDPLRDWQAVVLGGGVVNGLSQAGVWPAPRVAELLKGDAELAKRWAAALKLAHAMADSEKVPTGTRYDAVRMVALDAWAESGPRLRKYLAKGANAELQQGAVSGLADVDRAEVGPLLAKALPDLTDGNRKLALDALLRDAPRANALLDALDAGTAEAKWLAADHKARLLKHPDDAVRARAAKRFGP